MLRRGRAGDTGSAVVDMVLVAPLVVVVFLLVVQVGVAVYVRTTLVACAQEGARTAALSGAGAGAGAVRVRSLADASLGAGAVDSVDVARRRRGAFEEVVVTVRARLPLLGLAGPAGGLVVQAHAWAGP